MPAVASARGRSARGLRIGLRARLALLVIAALSPLAAVQIHGLHAARATRIAAAFEKVQASTRTGAERYRDAIDDARASLDLLAHVPEVVGDTPEACQRFLTAIRGSRPWADAFFRIDASGRITCATVEAATGLDVSRRPWYLKTIAAGRFTVSDFYTTLARRRPTVAAALPLAEPTRGGYPPVLMANLDLGWFDELAAAIGRANGATVLLVDGQGRGLSRYPTAPGIPGLDLSGLDAVRASLLGEEGAVEARDADGKAFIFGHLRLPGTDARLIVGLDRATVLAPIDAAILRTALLMLALAAGIGGVIWFAGKRIFVEPLLRAGEALRKSEGFLRGIVDGSGDCITVLDIGGNLEFVSRDGLRLTEADDPAVLIGRPFVGLWPAAMRVEILAKLADARGGATVRFDAEIRSAGGEARHVDVIVTPLSDAEGHSDRLVAMARDITDLKLAERSARDAEGALRESEARYRLLAETTSDVITRIDPAFRYAYVSPSCRAVLGYEPEALTGTDAALAMHPEDAAAVRDHAQALLGGDAGERDSVTYRMRHSDGRWIWVENRVNLVRDEGTRHPVGLICSLRDVSERQRQAEELRLAKEAAEAARAQADAANEAKTDFLATMSHEIRTPLNAILGFTGLIVDKGADLPPDILRHVRLVQTSGSALLTIVNDILDFSQVEAGAVELDPRPFALHALIDDCLSVTRGALGTKALCVRSNLDPALPRGVVGDEARLRQILLNLLNNAVKFTREGYVALAVRHEGGSPGGERIRFAISDTGIGIPKEKQGRLFERFSQADGSIRRDFGGTGLGLAICKRLVELMDGEIGMFSEEGRGTTFWFTLTLPRGRLGIEPPRLVPEAGAPSHRTGRVLVVEDLDINQVLARAILEIRGHTVDVVGDGAAAVLAVRDRAYDLVLMDVQMPGMDGLTATRIIRRTAGPGPRLPIIAMTANVLPEQIRSFREAGMDDHVGKPFKRAELYATLDQWLAAPAEAAAPESPPASVRAAG